VKTPRVAELSANQLKELEAALGFGFGAEGWRDDWTGNLAYAEDDIVNPISKGKKKQSFRQSLVAWADNNDQSKRILGNLMRYICSMDKIPPEARRIIASADLSSVESIETAIRRVGFDPLVLEQDGWVTVKSDEREGAIGGPFLIGDYVRWKNSDAVVIAFVHDQDLGDLWKACWIEDLRTFDLEAEELVEGRRKWERRNNPTKTKANAAEPTKQSRANGSSDFRVPGVQEGIVLAASMSPGARPGVFWPARVMHSSETKPIGAVNPMKRSIAKYQLSVVFLSPYWDVNGPSRRGEALSEQGDVDLGAGALFQIESVEANAATIKEYGFDPNDGLDWARLEMAFRFTGLPKAAFGRFVDSHRLALSLKHYARMHVKKKISATEQATFGLIDSHPLAVLAPVFPSVVLHLPFGFILQGLPVIRRENVFDEEKENVLNLATMVDSLQPPRCWCQVGDSVLSNNGLEEETPVSSPGTVDSSRDLESNPDWNSMKMEHFGPLLKKSPLLEAFFRKYSGRALIRGLGLSLLDVYARTRSDETKSDGPNSNNNGSIILHAPRDVHLIEAWAALKSNGCDVITTTQSQKPDETVNEWKRLLERLYVRLKGLKRSSATLVTTDSKCNLHVTSGHNVERAVRLPAALKAAKMAGAGSTEQIQLCHSVQEEVVDYVERTLLSQAHDQSYLKRMKSRCMTAKSETDVLHLTEDSDGVGGEDTRGCRGTWPAAVHAVAITVDAVNKVVQGQFSNAFCATRPPGHHAGRKLHAMKAVSNGFCILNAVACAAIHAVSPIAEGGLGLRRVAVLDFDVHHGNGTQDILCGVYDPRFLYVSIHAGGVNSTADQSMAGEESDSEAKQSHEGIFPGKCGNTSPHRGVLNIPLGPNVTPHAVGNALLNKITPAVEKFCPDILLLSAGFDAHKHDPMGLGSLSAEDFAHITEAACQLAFKCCSGRVVSVLEGGYGVPCCRPQELYLSSEDDKPETTKDSSGLRGEETSQHALQSDEAGLMKSSKVQAQLPTQSAGNSSVTRDTDMLDEPVANETPMKTEEKDGTSEKQETESAANGSSAFAKETAPAISLDVIMSEVGHNSAGKELKEAPEITKAHNNTISSTDNDMAKPSPDVSAPSEVSRVLRPQPSKLADLGKFLPENMDDRVPLRLQRKLERCHDEGFIDCVREHVSALFKCSSRTTP